MAISGTLQHIKAGSDNFCFWLCKEKLSQFWRNLQSPLIWIRLHRKRIFPATTCSDTRDFFIREANLSWLDQLRWREQGLKVFKCNQSNSFQKCDSCPAGTSTQDRISPFSQETFNIIYAVKNIPCGNGASSLMSLECIGNNEQTKVGTFMTKLWTRMHCSESLA